VGSLRATCRRPWKNQVELVERGEKGSQASTVTRIGQRRQHDRPAEARRLPGVREL